MTTKTRGESPVATQSSLKRRLFVQYFPLWALLTIALAMMLPTIMTWGTAAASDVIQAAPGVAVNGAETAVDLGGDIISGLGDTVSGWLADDDNTTIAIAPLFTAEVQYWQEDIQRWSNEYGLDANLLATVMQIESCGYEQALSVSGAQGLFQVMPMHFAADADAFDPNTNAQGSAGVLVECLAWAKNDTGLAMACYNGGPSVVNKPFHSWVNETQHYYTWGTGIYADAKDGKSSSDTLVKWLDAGGVSLCNQASATQ